MLQHFTWQQFLVAALILTLLWYAGVILIFYRQKINDLLNGKSKPVAAPEPLRHAWDDDYDDLPLDEPEDDLLGKQELPEGMSKLSMAQFGFAPAIDEPEISGGADGKEEQKLTATEEFENGDVQRGLIPDVMEELKTIFHILERDNGTKEDFISLFALVSSKYHQIKNTPHERALNEHIRENLLFPISDKELESLWV